MHPTAHPNSAKVHTDPYRVGILLALVVVTIFGFYLRLRCLGCLGFRWDEDLTSLAVKSLMENGVPDLPSGMIYTRFYAYQWLLAASAKTMGFSESSIRLPGVILSTGLIPVAYWIVGKMFEPRVGLIVAAGLAFSFDQVEMARTARMYAPFFLIYTLAAYSIYHAYYKDSERIFSPWPLLLSLIALSLHQLAYSLAAIVAIAVFLNPRSKRVISLVLQAGVIGVAFLATKSIQEYFFYRGQRLLQAGHEVRTADAQNSTLIESIFNQIDLPKFDLATQVGSAIPVYAIAIGLLGIACAIWIVRASEDRHRGPILWALVVIALSVLHQFNLVLIVLSGAVLASGKGLPAGFHGTLLKAACASGAIFLAWIAVILLIMVANPVDLPIAETGIRKMLRALVDYPNFRLFWSYVLERPLLAVPLALGTAWALDRISRRRNEPVALFLLAAFWAPVFLNGIIDTKYEFFRYNLHVDVFFLMVCCAGVIYSPQLWRRMRNTGEECASSQRSPGLWVVTIVLVIVSVNPVAAAMTSTRGYYETGYWYRLFGLDKYQDFSAPATFVRERLGDADRIFVAEPREYWNYIGRVDYWIASDRYQSQTFIANGTALDLYIAVPVLSSLDQVKSAIRDAPNGNIWLLFSDSQLQSTPWISRDIKEFLWDLRDDTVYVGRDRQTRVVRLPSDHPVRSSVDSQ